MTGPRGDPLDEGPPPHIEVIPGVSAYTGRPFCRILIGGKSYGQVDPDELRAMALRWLEAAEAAEADALVFAALRAVGWEVTDAVRFIEQLRRRRGEG